MLTDIANKQGPEQFLVMLGYAGWEPQQLDDEVKQDCWLALPATESLLFETPYEQRWQQAGLEIGIDIQSINQAGNA